MDEKMNLGKYKGVSLKDIVINDASYVKWYGNEFNSLTRFNECVKKAFRNIDDTLSYEYIYENGKALRKYIINEENLNFIEMTLENMRW